MVLSSSLAEHDRDVAGAALDPIGSAHGARHPPLDDLAVVHLDGLDEHLLGVRLALRQVVEVGRSRVHEFVDDPCPLLGEQGEETEGILDGLAADHIGHDAHLAGRHADVSYDCSRFHRLKSSNLRFFSGNWRPRNPQKERYPLTHATLAINLFLGAYFLAAGAAAAGAAPPAYGAPPAGAPAGPPAAALRSPEWPWNVRVGANSPSLWPTMFSVTKTGRNFLPLCTANVTPTISGRTVERRDQVLSTFFDLVRCASSTFTIRCLSTNGPFLTLRAMTFP